MRPDITLAFDTSAAHCAAALLLPDGTVIESAEPMSKGQAERLLPLLEELLAKAGLAWSDVTLLGVGTGPGNFTGVRIAVAAARGLSLGLKIPAIGVTTLEALALDIEGPLLVAQDAKREMAYLQGFAPETPAILAEIGTLPEGFRPEGAFVTGELSARYAEIHGLSPLAPRYALAEATARKALILKETTFARPAPFYLRGADAAPPSDPPPVILDA